MWQWHFRHPWSRCLYGNALVIIPHLSLNRTRVKMPRRGQEVTQGTGAPKAAQDPPHLFQPLSPSRNSWYFSPLFTHLSCCNTTEIWGIIALFGQWNCSSCPRRKLEVAGTFHTPLPPAALANTTAQKDFMALRSPYFGKEFIYLFPPTLPPALIVKLNSKGAAGIWINLLEGVIFSSRFEHGAPKQAPGCAQSVLSQGKAKHQSANHLHLWKQHFLQGLRPWRTAAEVAGIRGNWEIWEIMCI